MARIQISSSGSTANIEKFLKMAGQTDDVIAKVTPVVKAGQAALEAATPKATGVTSQSWTYEIKREGDGVNIYWRNTNQNQGKLIAVLIRYGHGTRNGGYVPPNDFITPALQKIFQQIADNAWKAVTSK